jgi:hypothetical protein
VIAFLFLFQSYLAWSRLSHAYHSFVSPSFSTTMHYAALTIAVLSFLSGSHAALLSCNSTVAAGGTLVNHVFIYNNCTSYTVPGFCNASTPYTPATKLIFHTMDSNTHECDPIQNSNWTIDMGGLIEYTVGNLSGSCVLAAPDTPCNASR